jgi:hypothetical protein
METFMVDAYQVTAKVVWYENSFDIQPDVFGFWIHYLLKSTSPYLGHKSCKSLMSLAQENMNFDTWHKLSGSHTPGTAIHRLQL